MAQSLLKASTKTQIKQRQYKYTNTEHETDKIKIIFKKKAI
jgi:hypothetical protein